MIRRQQSQILPFHFNSTFNMKTFYQRSFFRVNETPTTLGPALAATAAPI